MFYIPSAGKLLIPNVMQLFAPRWSIVVEKGPTRYGRILGAPPRRRPGLASNFPDKLKKMAELIILLF